MVVAHLTNTPEPLVWSSYTLRMLIARAARAAKVLPYLNPFAGGESDEKAITNPDQIRSFLGSMGVRRA